MTKSNAVKIIETCRVSQPLGFSSDMSSLPLTMWEVRWLRFPPTQRLYFFRTPTPFQTVITKLKNSLSLTLRNFQPVAGTLTWPPVSPEPLLLFDPTSSVSLTVSESCLNFDHLTQNGPRRALDLHHFIPELGLSETEASAMSLQVTSFPNSGFSIGISMHHAVLDGRSATLFMKSWAHNCRENGFSELPDELTPIYNQNLLKDPSRIKECEIQNLLNQNGPNNRRLFKVDFMCPSETAVRVTFMLESADLEMLREHVESRSRRVSTFSLTCGYVWVCMVRANPEFYGSKVPRKVAYFIFSADCRVRLEPRLPNTYFGNCVAASLVRAKICELLGERGVVVAATAIDDSVHSLKGKKVWEERDAFAEAFDISHSEKILSVAGSPQFGMYETDFGWGKLAKAEIVSTDFTGALGLSESSDGSGGVEIGLALNEDVMKAFSSAFSQGLQTIKNY